MKLLNNLDLTKNQLLNAVLQTLAQAPTDPTPGQVYYNSADKRVYVWTGAIWLAMDAKDASPTAVSIVKTINDGNSMIEMSKIKDLVESLSGEKIVDKINSSSGGIKQEKINGLKDIISELQNGIKNDSIVANINSGNKTINTNKITGLDTALAGKVTDQEAQNKANTALQQAKAFTTQEINKLINGAGAAYDTLKELGDMIDANKGMAQALTNQISKKTNKFTEVMGNGVLKEFVMTHNLNSQDCIAVVRENASPFAEVLVDKEYIDANKVKITFATAPKVNEFKLVVIG